MKKKKKYYRPIISNLELMNQALKTLQEDTGFHFKNIKFGDGYFIFSYEKNTVCHFEIQEIPGFLFGLWNTKNVDVNYYDSTYRDAELILFSQAKITLDKFKPSNCALRAPLGRYRYLVKPDNNNIEWSNYNAEALLKYIKNHRLEAYYKSNFSDWDVNIAFNTFDLIIDFIKTRLYKLKDYIKTKFDEYKIRYITKKLLSNLKVKAFLIDEGECVSPRLDLAILPDETFTESDYSNLYTILDMFDEKYFSILSVHYDDYSKDWKKRYLKRIKYLKKEINRGELGGTRILWEKI